MNNKQARRTTGSTIAAMLIAIGTSAAADAKATSTTKAMTFEQCLGTIRNVAAGLGAVPVNIVETTNVRIVRFRTVDGSVLVTCSGPDRKMIITKSDNPG